MYHFSIMAFFLFLVGCGTKMDPANEAMYSFENKFIKKMNKEYSYETFGIGGGYKDRKVNKVKIDFTTDTLFDIQTARKLIVEMADEMLNDMNSDKFLMEMMYESPATVKNIQLSLIRFASTETDDNVLGFVKLICEDICYGKIDPITCRFTATHIETYEDAKKILQKQ